MTTPHAVKDRPYSREEVVKIIQSVVAGVGGETESTRKLQTELKALASYIENMRTELAQSRSNEISHTHIPTATDELDAVVGETAKATGAIMDACEKIEKVASGLEAGPRDELTGIVTTIYEACTFQDITGQRITKVVKTLKSIEAKVAEILSAFGPLPGGGGTGKAAGDGGDPLLNGPQLNGPEVNQADIDKLLGGFDK